MLTTSYSLLLTYGRDELKGIHVPVEAVMMGDFLVPNVAVEVSLEVQFLAVLSIGLISRQGHVDQLQEASANISRKRF